MFSALAVVVAALLAASGAQAQPREVAVTVDDLPFASGLDRPLTPADAARAAEVNRVLLKALKAHHAPATGFVNQRSAEQLGAPAGAAMLRAWTAPSFDLGNHLYSHPDVNALSADQAEQEITRGEPMIANALARVGRKPRYLRFPFNHTGDTAEKHDAVAAFMAARGYRLAPCTIEAEDFAFNRAYEIALAHDDKAMGAKIRAAYLAFTQAEIDWYAKLDADVLGREAPHVMLLHASLLNRDSINEVLALFEQRGFHFISLDKALADPAYATPEAVTKFGPMWGYRWARILHVKVRGQDEPDMPAWVDAYARGADG
jgi:peptidoglycan/xylan/chitin deacetylase (PgdA/CDA1 family)